MPSNAPLGLRLRDGGGAHLVGEKWAYRKREHAWGEPVRPVMVIKAGPPKSYKYRVRWLDGEYEGLEEWGSSRQLLCPWDQAEDLLNDERRQNAVKAASERLVDTAPFRAAEYVFRCRADRFELISKGRYRGILLIRDFERTLQGTIFTAESVLAQPLGFVDRFGDYLGPVPVAVGLAQEICRRFPLDLTEEATQDLHVWRQAVVTGRYVSTRNPHTSWGVQRHEARETLRELEETCALIFEWCGTNEMTEFREVDALREEVYRLQSLVVSLIGWLRSHGYSQKAGVVARQLTNIIEAKEKAERNAPHETDSSNGRSAESEEQLTAPVQHIHPKHVNRKELAHRLGISVAKARQLVRDGQIPSYGEQRLVLEHHFEDYIRFGQAPPPQGWDKYYRDLVWGRFTEEERASYLEDGYDPETGTWTKDRS